jgi:hypothetical protein
VAPAAASTYNFDGSLNLNVTNNITLTAADSPINFNAGASAFTLWGGNIRIGTVANNSPVMQTINLRLILNGTRTLNVGSAGMTLGAMLGSTGTGRTATKTGTGDLILHGNATGASVSYAVNAGRMIFDTLSGHTTSLTAGAITLASGTQLRLDNVGNVVFGTTTANSGSTIRLNNSGLVTGAVVVNSGASLIGNGNVTGTIQLAGGTVAPGFSIGTIGNTASLTLDAASISNFEVDRSAGQNADFLNVGGALTLNGTVNIANLGATLQAGDTFDFFGAGSVSGAWTLGTVPSLDSGLAWDFSALNTSGVASVYVVPEPGSVLLAGLGGLALLRARKRRN